MWVDWDDKAKGKVPQYNYYIQTSSQEGDTDVIQVKSKTSFDKLLDIDAVFTLGYWSMDNRAGLTLLDAKAARSDT